MTFIFHGSDGQHLKSRILVLQNWALKVSQSYDRIMERVSSLEASHKQTEAVAEHEKQLMRIIELFMQDDVRACTVMDYVIVFFRLVLVKLRQGGQDFDDVKQLHKALTQEEVAQTFNLVLSRLGFPATEQDAIRVLLEVLQHRKWPTSEVMTTSPGGDAQISSALLYVRLQQDLGDLMSSALQRALCAAHECILTDIAISRAITGHDVNINASDVRKDDAYVDARVKYEDYANFERDSEEGEQEREAVSKTLSQTTLVKESAAVNIMRDDKVRPHSNTTVKSASSEREAPAHRLKVAGIQLPSGEASATGQHSVKGQYSSETPHTAAAEVDPATAKTTMEMDNRTFVTARQDVLQTAIRNASGTKQDTAGVDDSMSDPNQGVSEPSPRQECTANTASPTSIDRARLDPDPSFYVICYDVNTSSDPTSTAGEEEQPLRHRPRNHNLNRATSETIVGADDLVQDEARSD